MLKTITSWFLTMGCMLMLCQTVHANDRLALAVPPSIWVQQDNEKISGPLIDLLETIFSDLGVAIAPV